MTKELVFLAQIFWAGTALQATPARVAAIDATNQVVADDWDAALYYHLAPNFKNHWYFDIQPTGKSTGWAFLDLGLGTFVVWWNKDYEAAGLYDAISAPGNGMGLSNVELASAGGDADPFERRLKAPDTKAALGYGIQVGDALSIGFCLRLAEFKQERAREELDGLGGPSAIGSSSAQYIGGAYPVLNVFRASNTQSSRGLVLAPSFGLAGDSYTFDVKGEFVSNRFDNSHSEDDFLGQDRGSIVQTLKDKGAWSWLVKPKLRYRLGQDDSMVLRGTYGLLDQGSEHRVKGSFGGAGFTAKQLAGYDHVDQDQAFGITEWESMLAWTRNFGDGKHLVVLGVRLLGSRMQIRTRSFSPRTGGASLDDLVLTADSSTAIDSLSAPVFIGSEATLLSWLRGRASLQRSFYSSTRTGSVDQAFSAVDGSLSGRSKRDSSSDNSPGWTLNAGFGVDAGSIAWDFNLNTTLLGSTGAFANPLAQSSFTYSFR